MISLSLLRPLTWPPIFPLEKGLVLWYPPDDRSGAFALDRSGKKNHGTLSGASWVAGRRGAALSFDGASNLVNCGSNAVLDNLSACTFMAWIKPINAGGGNQGRIIGKLYIFLRMAAPASLAFVVTYSTRNLSRVAAAASLTLNVWRHVAVTWDGSMTAANVHIYVNGIEVSYYSTTDALGTRDNDAALNFYVGNRSDLLYGFNGVIGEVRIYNRVLSAAEVKRCWESEMLLTRH